MGGGGITLYTVFKIYKRTNKPEIFSRIDFSGSQHMVHVRHVLISFPGGVGCGGVGCGGGVGGVTKSLKELLVPMPLFSKTSA